MSRSFIITLDDELIELIKRIETRRAEGSGPCTDVTVELVQQMFEDYVLDESLKLKVDGPANDPSSVAEAMQAVLEPSLRRELVVAKVLQHSAKASLTSLERFDILARSLPTDPWIKAVLGTEIEQDLWKAALVIVYESVFGDQRAKWETWILIERAFRMLKDPIDKAK